MLSKSQSNIVGELLRMNDHDSLTENRQPANVTPLLEYILAQHKTLTAIQEGLGR